MQLLSKMIDSYLSASKKEKGKILSQYMKLTGIKNKKTVTKRFERFRKTDRNKSKSDKKLGRPVKYGDIEKEIFKNIWELSGYICAQRLISFIQINKDSLYKEYACYYPQKSLEKIIDINEGSAKALISSIPKSKKKRFSNGNCELYKYVAIEANFNRFAKVSPGYFEIDFVEHKDFNLSGQYGVTLNFSDIYSQYILRRAGLGKDYKTVSMLAETIINSIPFKVIKLHPDNEKTLLKLAYERSKKNNDIEVTRSRAYKKNDNAYVEQKNGDKVRKLVGYYRYDTEYEINLLNQIYEIADIIDNYFIPSYKLKRKIINERGQIVSREYEEPKTPYQRIMESRDVDDKVKEEMRRIFEGSDYIKLKRELDKKVNELFEYKLNKKIKIDEEIYELCA